MKKLFVLAFATGILALSACSQKLKESDVPAAAKTAFQKKFPNITATWEKEGKNYEVNFKQDGKTMSSVIDKNGTIIETETNMTVKDLPQSAQNYLKEHYKDAKIRETAKVEKANGQVNYEVLLNGKEVMFDANGNFIKTEKE